MNDWPLMDDGRDSSWMSRGACHKTSSPVWLTGEDPSNPGLKAEVRAAKRICWSQCKVRPECEKYGKTEPVGIWGGQTASERGIGRRKRVA